MVESARETFLVYLFMHCVRSKAWVDLSKRNSVT